MFKSILLTVLTLGFTFLTASAGAEETVSTDQAKFRVQAQDFYLKQAAKQQWSSQAKSLFQMESLNTPQVRCDEDDEDNGRVSCLTILCQFAHCSGSTGRDIAEACRGSNGRCVQELCKTSHCSGSTGRDIAAACRGTSGLCVEELCKTSHCSGSTGRDIATACEGVDGQCVVELCKTSHCSGSTGRDIARTCAGN